MTSPSALKPSIDSTATANRFHKISFVVLAGLFIFLTKSGWLRWGDPLSDFGRALYIPWRILEGEVLYRDIVSYYGPLSYYLNALWFRIFGTSILTLALCNLALTGIVLWMITRYFARATSAGMGLLAGIVFLILFAFPNLGLVGGFNFIFPYSHEATHGTLLSIAFISCLDSYFTRGKTPALAGAGLFFGFVVMTKPEILIADLAVLMAAAGIQLLRRRFHLSNAARTTALFTVSAVLPLAGFWFYFAQLMPAHQTLESVFAGWDFELMRKAAETLFYRSCIGWDHPFDNVLKMVWPFMALISFMAFGIILDSKVARLSQTTARRVAGISVVLLTAFLLVTTSFKFWQAFMRGLPLAGLAAWVWLFLGWFRNKQDSGAEDKDRRLLIWGVYGLALMAKIILSARVQDYGFYLAMPVFLFLVAVILDRIPDIFRRVSPGFFVRIWFLTGLSVCLFFFAVQSIFIARAKTEPVGSGADTVLTYSSDIHPVGKVIQNTVLNVRRIVPPEAGLAVIAEGEMINYLARRKNPLPIIHYTAADIAIHGEPSLMAMLGEVKPDFIIVIQKKAEEYGFGYFGEDPHYGKNTVDWVREHYDPIETFYTRAEPPYNLAVVLYKLRP